mmetsp:Transcript_32374/g.69339  ORF Transcript_32374/g.69339 Transcript_32374/m.69339 type:complete len:474 (-) Transcript_32374:64-1485(-)|eukprot:CAMPEP_0206449680 /NCGR_PEP_ID=MMETSP0324_2-20121206/18244_1 /ASSEMBLY_ACC=CAM_ASM_000836 /TAXON_ID=2866 /ORGANISM="Crypthecodinium cohnii, Strain Seligo" /LENGTH=473 /DNA_ID=CAMNT_0053919125 /DNA_START=235 /DNA_END=1656 /DNA_ORIENTATION=-
MVLRKRTRTVNGGVGRAAKAARRGGAAGSAADSQRVESLGATAEDGDEELPSSDDEASSTEAVPTNGRSKRIDDEDEVFFETADEKRVRLAKEYIGRLGEGKEKEDVQEHLEKDIEDQSLHSRIKVSDLSLGEAKLLKQGHRYPLTCVCLNDDETTAWTGAKDCNVVRWNIETGQKAYLSGTRNVVDCGGHFQPVLAMCLVPSRSLLVSGGVDRLVRFWDERAPTRSSCSSSLHGHAASVTGIAAENDGSKLYTASMDKSLRIWDLRMQRCLDTLFGHVEGITCMDSFYKGRPVTGGTDKTVRLWKMEKETHLMYSRHSYSVDAVTVADQDRFVSGSQDGCLHLWSPTSKKPLATAMLGPSNWISSLKAIRRSNVFFSGSIDGKLRCWRFARPADGEALEEGAAAAGAAAAAKGLQLTEALPAVQTPGCVNGIAVGKKFIACAIGKEHRLGRWNYDRSKSNGLMLLPLSYHEG